jgi:methionine-rich copper-binding protein CopC
MTRTLRRWALLAALAAALGGLGVGPASAHDELISTDPAIDASVQQAPTSVALTFSSAVLGIGAAIEVSGPDGASWSTGEVGISGATVSRAMRSGAPVGRYTVAWRVAAGDGHSVSGQFGFTVTVGSTSGTSTTSPAEATPPSGSRQQADGSSTLANVALGAVAVLVLGLLVIVARRVAASRRRAAP